MVNYGQSGTTALSAIYEGRSMITSARYQDLQSDATAGGYDAAIVLLGTNDAKEVNLPLQENFVAGYLEFVENLVATLQPRAERRDESL